MIELIAEESDVPLKQTACAAGRSTRILHGSRDLRVLEGQLSFAHVGETKFVDQRVADRPSVARIVLLVTRTDVRSESRNVCAGSLEVVKGLKIRVVREVVIEAEILPAIDVVIDADGELILGVGARWRRLVSSIGTVRARHEAKQIDGHRIHALALESRWSEKRWTIR